ncbi:hypothetical protein [Roseibium alexandrii]|uniref:Uncharacterized protein n=1 Tax=Roseibium alexandrii (strain DSM 17067 / NCIMB 14079 / DFL-11) TaxID=244592 RepID=A0A5E8GY29_ROSAD|nr:hypothetical protein [Roseibium alexandrii]EEE43924.2 hypothetical protein SADFL11_1210 [Roseibium alexandrii DFL-11]
MALAMDWPQAQVDEGSANSATILPFETDDLSPQNPTQSLTRYQYFFVPSHQKEEDDTDCVTKPGAFLRLGSYSDIEEESAQSDNGVAAYYPSRHIASEAGDGVYKNAAGPRAAQSCGITMACDGRVLIKSDEKFFVETTDLVDIHCGNEIVITADTGPITTETGDQFSVAATKKVSLHSGAATSDNFVPSDKNTSGEKGVEIIANEGNSNAFLEAKDIVTHAHGSKTTHVDGTQTNVVRSDTLNDTWGNARTIFRGSNLSLYFAGGLSYRASASLNVSTSIDLNFLMTDFKFTLCKFEKIKWGVDLKDVVFKTRTLESNLTQLSNEFKNLSTSTVFYEIDLNMLNSQTNQISTEMGNMKASIMSQLNIQL